MSQRIDCRLRRGATRGLGVRRISPIGFAERQQRIG